MIKTLEELEFRRSLCQHCIRIIDQAEDDPRKPEAMQVYKEQLASIDAQITEITGTPPPVVVNLKTASLFGKSMLAN